MHQLHWVHCGILFGSNHDGKLHIDSCDMNAYQRLAHLHMCRCKLREYCVNIHLQTVTPILNVT